MLYIEQLHVVHNRKKHSCVSLFWFHSIKVSLRLFLEWTQKLNSTHVQHKKMVEVGWMMFSGLENAKHLSMHHTDKGQVCDQFFSIGQPYPVHMQADRLKSYWWYVILFFKIINLYYLRFQLIRNANFWNFLNKVENIRFILSFRKINVYLI